MACFLSRFRRLYQHFDDDMLMLHESVLLDLFGLRRR